MFRCVFLKLIKFDAHRPAFKNNNPFPSSEITFSLVSAPPNVLNDDLSITEAVSALCILLEITKIAPPPYVDVLFVLCLYLVLRRFLRGFCLVEVRPGQQILIGGSSFTRGVYVYFFLIAGTVSE